MKTQNSIDSISSTTQSKPVLKIAISTVEASSSDSDDVFCVGYCVLNHEPTVYLSDGRVAYGSDGDGRESLKATRRRVKRAIIED